MEHLLPDLMVPGEVYTATFITPMDIRRKTIFRFNELDKNRNVHYYVSLFKNQIDNLNLTTRFEYAMLNGFSTLRKANIEEIKELEKVEEEYFTHPLVRIDFYLD